MKADALGPLRDSQDGMKRGATGRLRDAIESEILIGMLRPGERLDEVSLANRYGVSRTPVREAIAQLASTGVIEVRPHRSAVVAQVSPQKLVEMFDVMACLEGHAGALAARRHSSEDLERLLAAHESCKKAALLGDADEYYYVNETFHHAIYVASHNAFLTEQCQTLHRRLKPYRRMQLQVRNRVSISLAEHDKIVMAIQACDASMADELLQSHIRIQGERFGDLIASLGAVNP